MNLELKESLENNRFMDTSTVSKILEVDIDLVDQMVMSNTILRYDKFIPIDSNWIDTSSVMRVYDLLNIQTDRSIEDRIRSINYFYSTISNPERVIQIYAEFKYRHVLIFDIAKVFNLPMIGTRTLPDESENIIKDWMTCGLIPYHLQSTDRWWFSKDLLTSIITSNESEDKYMNKVIDSLGDRMKKYENISRIKLTGRMPIILRIDGKAFHSYTRGLDVPFDGTLAQTFWAATHYVMSQISGAKIAYHQSDEVSILITNYDKLNTEAWFDNNLQKMVSIAASMFTYAFNDTTGTLQMHKDPKPALFDCRAFVLPKEEVANYFLWRQQDATKNSISMAARSEFSHNEVDGLSGSEKQEKLFSEKGINWNDYDTWKKRGACVLYTPVNTASSSHMNVTQLSKQKKILVTDTEIPIFSKDRDYINRFVYLEDESEGQ